MKKVLMVCEAFGGGVFTYVTQLCNDMVSEFDVYLAYAKRPQTPENFRDFIDPRVHLIEVMNFGQLQNPVADIKVIRELRQIEKQVNPDIIHLHSSIAGGIGRIAFKGNHNSVIYTPHGYSFILMGGGLKSKVYRAMESFLGHHSNSLILTCTESEDEVSKTLSNRTAYIETGVNLADLSKTLDDIQPSNTGKFTVFTLGRAAVQKQPQLFNRIAELVPDAEFVWIGGGELEYELTAPNIEVTGWMSRANALALAKGADVFVLCSLGEAIAMSLIENMFIKKLCLVSNTMGNKSVIQDGQNGYACTTPEEYAQHIKDAMNNFPTALPERAYQDVLNVYNTKVMEKKYVAFYNKLIQG